MKISRNRILLIIVVLLPFQDLPIPGLSHFYTKPLSFLLLTLTTILFYLSGKRVIVDKKFTLLIFSLLLISFIDYITMGFLYNKFPEPFDIIRSLTELLLFLINYNILYTYFSSANRNELINFLNGFYTPFPLLHFQYV